MQPDSDVEIVEYRGSNAPNTANKRHGRRSKAPFIPPKEIIEVPDSSDDEQEPRAGPSATPRLTATRSQPLFLPESDDEGDGNGQPTPIARAAAPSREPTVPADPTQFYVTQVSSIIPDVDPLHVATLIPRCNGNVVEQIVNLLLESSDYPKIQNKGKGKRKRDEEDDGGSGRVKVVKLDYASKDRTHMGGHFYHDLAIDRLCMDFPFIPKAHIRQTYSLHNSFYAPTFLALKAELDSGALPYQRLTNGSAASRTRNKGKQAERIDEELKKEIQWVLEKAVEDRAFKEQQMAEQLRDAQDEQIECGCCFSESPLRKVIQCPDAHLFCRDCMTHYCETKLGEHDINLTCMDQSGCKLVFAEEELKKFLPQKLLDLYYRVKQRKEIEAAGVENLEECPFCDYKVIIENPDEKLFRCARDECGVVSCRACKKPDHLPKGCEEAESDKKLDARHTVEEAMTRALLRNCPKCDKAFLKEAGCNKMTCPNCRTLSCYICRKAVTGYDHFNQTPAGRAPTAANSSKCPLWDTNLEQQHANEVASAAKKAVEEMKRANPGVDEKDLHVELPKGATAGPSNANANMPGAAALAVAVHNAQPRHRRQQRQRQPAQPPQPFINPLPPAALAPPVQGAADAFLNIIDPFNLRAALNPNPRRQLVQQELERQRENELRHIERVQLEAWVQAEQARVRAQMAQERERARRHRAAPPRAAVHVPPAPVQVQAAGGARRVGGAPTVTMTVNGRAVQPEQRDLGNGGMVFLFGA